MIAQKLKNNKIAVGGAKPRKDAIQVIDNLKVGEFFNLVRAARNWDKSLNDRRDIIFTTYENEHSKVCKEFDRIYLRRKIFAEKAIAEFNDVAPVPIIVTRDGIAVDSSEPATPEPTSNTDSKVDTVRSKTYKSTVIGTSKLIRIPSKQIIKIARRKGPSDANNKINSVCIDNRLREEFFYDCKKSQHYQDTKQYELLYIEEDKEVYEKYNNLITVIYEEGLQQEEK